MSKDEEKRRAAERAMSHVEDGMVVGVGTGSTVAFFIEALATRRHDIEGAVSSSQQSTRMLVERGIRVLELNATGDLPLYVDGADECDPHKRLIKGGGGALTREKIIAAASRRFVCLIDSGKRVNVLGNFPLPIEVIPMARSYVGRQIVARGGTPVWRDNYLTDNGNAIIDAHGWSIVDPVGLERELGAIAGVVCVGLFAARPADIVYCGDETL